MTYTMNTNRTLKYIFSLTLVLSTAISAFSQEEINIEKRVKGLRLGIDLSRAIVYAIDNNRVEFNISADYELGLNNYPMVQFGIQNYDYQKEEAHYKSKGYYVAVGYERNILKLKSLTEYEMFFLGGKLAYANMDYEMKGIKTQNYWGKFERELPTEAYTIFWFELSLGFRAQLYKSFFIGWSFHPRLRLTDSGDEILPYLSPGYGITKEGIYSQGFNFSIYYRIPMQKVDLTQKLIKQQ